MSLSLHDHQLRIADLETAFGATGLRPDVEAFLADPSCSGAMQQTGLTAAEIRRQAVANADMFERAGNRLTDNIAQYMFPVLARAK